ncbi:MAG: hypothetical protein KC584_19870, partial [Nitrospira sp.]|nr:hypothetical protein [Nitrospira sp.]
HILAIDSQSPTDSQQVKFFYLNVSCRDISLSKITYKQILDLRVWHQKPTYTNGFTCLVKVNVVCTGVEL